MRSKIVWPSASTALCWVLCSPAAFAANCGTIPELKGSTFSKQSERIQHLMLARLTRMTYAEAKQEFGVGVVIYGVPITANEQSFNSFKEILSSLSYTTNTILNKESELITEYGDAELVKAYLACVAAAGAAPAIRATVSEHGNRMATVAIEYHPNQEDAGSAKVEKVSVSSSTPKKNVDVISDGCKNRSISASGGVGVCRVTVRTDSAAQDILVDVVTKAGSVNAYVPPRMYLKTTNTQIPQKFYALGEPSKVVESIEWVAPGGNNTDGHGCTGALPDKSSYIIVDNGNPKPIVSAKVGHFGDNIGNARLETPPGVHKEVCFAARCGNSGGGAPQCVLTLHGNMSVITWEPKIDTPEDTKLLDAQLRQFRMQRLK